MLLRYTKQLTELLEHRKRFGIRGGAGPGRSRCPGGSSRASATAGCVVMRRRSWHEESRKRGIGAILAQRDSSPASANGTPARSFAERALAGGTGRLAPGACSRERRCLVQRTPAPVQRTPALQRMRIRRAARKRDARTGSATSSTPMLLVASAARRAPAAPGPRTTGCNTTDRP
jgi:hypothetical protein